MAKAFSILHRAAALLVALCLLVGMALPVYAAGDESLFFGADSETIPDESSTTVAETTQDPAAAGLESVSPKVDTVSETDGTSPAGDGSAPPSDTQDQEETVLPGDAPNTDEEPTAEDESNTDEEPTTEDEPMMLADDFYRQYLNGDDAGLEALMEKYGDPLTVYLDGYLHDIHEAEELMLDVFAYLFTKKPRIREGGFKAYLYKAARHMALRHKSKRRLMFSLDALTEEPDGQQLAEEVIGTAERNRILHYCMGEMNPDYREVLYLTYFEGMSYAQAAEVTGKTVKQITNLVYRGKESLRKLLEREGITNAEP